MIKIGTIVLPFGEGSWVNYYLLIFISTKGTVKDSAGVLQVYFGPYVSHLGIIRGTRVGYRILF